MCIITLTCTFLTFHSPLDSYKIIDFMPSTFRVFVKCPPSFITTNRMRTTRSVWGSLSRGGLCIWGGGNFCVQGMSMSGGVSVRGCLSRGVCPGMSVSREVSVQGSLCPVRSLSRGGLCPGVSVPGGLCPRGVSVQAGLCPGVSVRETASPVNRMTDACENITLAQTSFAGSNESVGDLGFPRQCGGGGAHQPEKGVWDVILLLTPEHGGPRIHPWSYTYSTS